MKKISLLLLLAGGLAQSHAQELKYTIKGKTDILPGNNEVTLVRYDLANGQRFDKAKVDADGEFSFTGTVPEPEIGQFLISGGRQGSSALCYLESGKIRVFIHKDKLFPTLSGTALNRDYNDFNIMMEHLLDSLNDAGEKVNQFSPGLKTAMLHIMQQFVPTHPNSLLTLYELNTHVARFPDEVSDLVKLYGQLTPELRKTQQGKDMASLIKGLSSNKIGDLATDFSLPDTTGRMVKLSDFRGKYVLLDFWATWCEPCMEEMPNVAAAYRKYQNKNFTVLGVSLDRPDTRVLWENVIKEKQMDWPQVSDLKWWNSEAALLYNIQGVPANFLIDPAGKIVGMNLRGEALQKKLDEIINQK